MRSDSARFLDTLTDLKRPYTQTAKGAARFSFSPPPATAKTDYYSATWHNYQKHKVFYERTLPHTAVPSTRGVEKVTSKHLVLGNRFKRVAHMDQVVSEVSDKHQVEELDSWNKQAFEGAENLKQIQLAEFALHNRIKHNDVEHFIMDRKSRTAMPAPLTKRVQSEAVLRHVQDITIKRLERKAINEMMIGQSKNARRYEDEMTTTFNNLKDQVANANRNREDLRRGVSQFRTELLFLEEEMNQLRRFFQEEDLKDKKKLKNLRPEDLAKLLSRKSQMQNELLLKEKQHAERVNEIKTRIRDDSEKAKKADNEVAQLRLQLEAVTASQAKHYREMLAVGSDTRTEGLLWIVKRLWHLGQDVMPDMFPEFLDLGSVDCILFLSQKSFELDEINDYMNGLQGGANEDPMQETKRDRWNNIQRRMRLLTKNLRIKKPLFIYDKKIKQTIVVWEPAELEDTQNEVFYQGGKEAFNEVLAVDNAKQEIKRIIQQTQEVEIKRLTRECFLNNYERRYRVSMKQLLSTIVGKETIERYMALIEKDRKELAEELARSKTFKFT